MKTPNELKASRKYNNKNKDLINEKSRKYTEENKERVRANKARYRERNREYIRARARERNLRLKNEREVIKMFGRKVTPTKKETVQMKKELAEANKKLEAATPDLVVEQPETVGMPGFTQDAPAPAPVVAPAPVQEPVAPAEQYQIIGQEIAQGEGLYVYKIVTNKYLGELGGVYEA